MKETFQVEEGYEIDVKRFYLPMNVDAKCPNCGSDIKFGADKDGFCQLNYPRVGVNEAIRTHCDECDSTVLMNGVIKITIEVDPDNLSID